MGKVPGSRVEFMANICMQYIAPNNLCHLEIGISMKNKIITETTQDLCPAEKMSVGKIFINFKLESPGNNIFSHEAKHDNRF